MTQLEIRPRESGVEMEEEKKKTWDTYFADSFARSPGPVSALPRPEGLYRENLKRIREEKCGKVPAKQ
jgi:hypothetical protein